MNRRKRAPTRRITPYEVGDIDRTVHNLLERHLYVEPCPLDSFDLTSMWSANMHELERETWLALEKWKQVPTFISPLRSPNTMAIVAHFEDNARLAIQFQADMLVNFSVWARHDNVMAPAQVLTPEKYEAFNAWARRSVHNRARVAMSKVSIEKITSIAKTVGQLYRMAPDLVRYTHPLTQQAMRAQFRMSALPDEWMLVDRTAVRVALDHLALCYLMPEDSDTDRAVKVWTAETAGIYSAYDSRISHEEIARLSSYTLPSSEDPTAIGSFHTKS